MNKISLLTLLFAGFIIAINGCIESGKPLPTGGNLPTNYIMVKDSSFTPSSLTVASGSSITFVNNTGSSHIIMSDDSTTIKPVTIIPGTSYFFKKDTVANISYHCTLHTNARGSFILTQ